MNEIDGFVFYHVLIFMMQRVRNFDKKLVCYVSLIRSTVKLKDIEDSYNRGTLRIRLCWKRDKPYVKLDDGCINHYLFLTI